MANFWKKMYPFFLLTAHLTKKKPKITHRNTISNIISSNNLFDMILPDNHF